MAQQSFRGKPPSSAAKLPTLPAAAQSPKPSVSRNAKSLLKVPSLQALPPPQRLDALKQLAKSFEKPLPGQGPLPVRERALASVPPRERQQLLKQEDALKAQMK